MQAKSKMLDLSSYSMKTFAVAPLAVAIANVSLPNASVAQTKALEEITVTATKQALDLQSVPQSINALSGDAMETMGIGSLSDVIKALPSVSLTAIQPGRNSLTMRGISSGSGEYYTDGQVAVYLDEIPMTTNSQQVGVRPIDMERVESLQGPQGTLYGASSQTGTIRYITKKPDHDGFGASVEAGYGMTEGGDDSYDVNGHINVPLIDDVLAMRAVAYASHDGGYVDNVYGRTLSGNRDNADLVGGVGGVDEDQNEYGTIGGRISFAMNFSENWHGLLTIVGEESELDGSWETDPYLGDYKITRFYDENRDDDWIAAAFTATGDLGFAEVTATVTTLDRDIAYNWDNDVYTQYKDRYWGAYYPLYDTDYNRSIIFNDQSQERETAEIRFTSTGDSRLFWTAGAYYEDVYDEWFYGSWNENLQDSPAWAAANTYAYYAAYYYGNTNQAYPLPASDLGYVNIFERTVKQTAVFSELTYDLTDSIQVLGGFRWAEYERDEVDLTYYPDGLITAGLYEDGDGATRSDGKDDDTIYKLSLRYTVDDDLMVYGLYSQGFRLGGQNSPRAAATGQVAPAFDTDTLDNFEFGMRSMWWDGRIKLNPTLFHMVWKDYQQSTTFQQWWNRGTLNAGDAEITGIEIDMSIQATDNLRFDVNLFAADAEFTEDVYFNAQANPNTDELDIRDGMDLPNSPDLKGYVAIHYDIPDVLGGDAWVYFDSSYQDETWNATWEIARNDKNGLSDTYTVSNLSFGLDMPNGLYFTMRVDNLFDEAGYNNVATGQNGYAELYNDPRFRNLRNLERPRSTWLTVRKEF